MKSESDVFRDGFLLFATGSFLGSVLTAYYPAVASGWFFACAVVCWGLAATAGGIRRSRANRKATVTLARLTHPSSGVKMITVGTGEGLAGKAARLEGKINRKSLP